jgi:hypothetical protein
MVRMSAARLVRQPVQWTVSRGYPATGAARICSSVGALIDLDTDQKHLGKPS